MPISITNISITVISSIISVITKVSLLVLLLLLLPGVSVHAGTPVETVSQERDLSWTINGAHGKGSMGSALMASPQKSGRAYFSNFPQSDKIHHCFAAAPLALTPCVRSQGAHGGFDRLVLASSARHVGRLTGALIVII